MKANNSLWAKWEELKDELLRRKVKKDMIEKIENLLVEERLRKYQGRRKK